MEKEALLTIILQDIKELETLVTTFKDKGHIPDVFIQLSQNKAKGILDEIQLLSSIKDSVETNSQNNAVSNISISEIINNNEPDKTEISSETVINKPNQTINTPSSKKREEEIKPEKPSKTIEESEKSSKNGKKPIIIGDLLGKDKPSYNERLASKQDTTSPKSYPPINDLRKAIGINDRFYFQRELFNGKSELLSKTIEQLNCMDNLDSALNFISSNFSWDTNNEAATAFITLIKRRFIKQ